MPKHTLITLGLAVVLGLAGQTQAQTLVSTFGGNPQHTANYSPVAQDLNAIHWSTSIDLNNTGAFAHYGAPLLTPANTILVPVKTASNGFQVNVFNAADGTALYTLTSDYIMPSHNWIPSYQPGLAVNGGSTRLYYAGAGGTIYYIDNPDSAGHGAPVQQVFYTSLANYQANAAAFNSTVFINTPITTDTNGNVFFGFRVQGTAPAPLSTTQSGFARIDASGNATYVLAGTAANDVNIGGDSHNSAPALSNDQSSLYVAVKSASTEAYGYLLRLNSTTLATLSKVMLKDPRNNNNASILDDGTSSPMVGPDGDVYFGVMGNPFNGSRGFLLHFNSDLSVQKTPGGFGWDYTAAVVPASMVPSYTGTSSYLLFTKYNNYFTGDGNGINRIAVLDPNATEVDPHTSSNGLLIMREVLTVIGPTVDEENFSPSNPLVVREWCINTAAVNPATNSVFTPSEDGHIYRWNLATNSVTQWLQLGPGVGEPYVPTVIGPDGTVFTLNGGFLWALGGLNGVGVGVTSSAPDVRTTVTGQSLTFTAAVTNTNGPSPTPTGTVTFTDTTYAIVGGVVQATTTTLAANVPLDGTGHASYASSSLTADKHFITVQYSGDSNFSAGSSSLVQYIHAGASSTALASTPNPSTNGQSVTFTATVAAVPPATGIPTGQVTFQKGNTFLAQVPLNSSGVASFSISTLPLGNNTITATYASDSLFAASSGNVVQVVQNVVSSTTTTVSSSANPSVFSQPVTFTATVTSSGGTPTGTATFKNGSTTLGTSNLDGAGHATLTTSTLAVGSNSITATYNGNSNFSSSTSSPLTQTVNKDATTTSVTSSLNPSHKNQSVTFTATVVASAPGTAVPTGTVTFKDGTRTLGSSTLNASGQATFSISNLNKGNHSITAVYGGSANFLTSTSPVLTQTVN